MLKLQQALNASDPDLQPRALIVEYEADGSVSISPYRMDRNRFTSKGISITAVILPNGLRYTMTFAG